MSDYLKDMVTELPAWARPIGDYYENPDQPVAPGLAKWVPKEYDPPKVGDEVWIRAWRESAADPGITGVVAGYQVCAGFLMVWVKPDMRPLWHLQQNPGRHTCLFTGIELAPTTKENKP